MNVVGWDDSVDEHRPNHYRPTVACMVGQLAYIGISRLYITTIRRGKFTDKLTRLLWLVDVFAS